MKIALAVDGSKHSQVAETLLAKLAGKRNHAVGVVTVTPPVISGATAQNKSVTEMLEEAGSKMLDQVVSSLRSKTSLRLIPRLAEFSNPADGILRVAERDKADLIVIGARGLRGLDAFLMGSVSQRVVRYAKSAVLVARGKKEDIPESFKILAAVDGSQASRRALSLVQKLANPRTLKLTLVHVAELPTFLATGLYGGAADPVTLKAYQDELAARKRDGQRLLNSWRKRLTPAFGPVEARLEEGYAAGNIIDTAKSGSFDLVVMGTRGLTGIKRFLLGSVAQNVCSHAPCSVLVVPDGRKI